MDRILILEDDEGRCSWFDRHFAQHERDATHDVALAVRWLEEREYSLIFLDHDLVEEHYFSEMADDESTGFAVASWLARHPECQSRAQIVVHSLNYSGAQRMIEVLQSAGRAAEHVPFPHLPWLF